LILNGDENIREPKFPQRLKPRLKSKPLIAALKRRATQIAQAVGTGAGAGAAVFENSLLTRSDMCAPFDTQYSTRSRFSSTLAGLVRGL
jgi:hypothetical protein